jgi:L-ascorbate metabolism protein UlaG (beta-lactamase superfamily)
MDLFTSKQQKIDRRATEVMAAYPALWSQMITEWHQPGSEDRAWLMYSTNYLFRTANVRWTIDPLRLKHRLPSAPEMSAVDLEDLSFILLTHQHGDHLDLSLLRQLEDFPILWVIPVPVLEVIQAKVEIPAGRLIVPEPMRRFEIHGMRIIPFDGLHWEKHAGTDSLRGVPAMGFLVEFNRKRWLFPGDTRSYDANLLPSFGSLNGLFAHLWLGRDCALMANPPLLNAFCRFCEDLMPKRVNLTHLDEFGRAADNFWDSGHFQKVSAWFKNHAPNILLDFACLGERINI